MTVQKEIRARFAPSPTGHLHVGNARTALFNWLFARSRGGVFVLRIEDTDTERSSRASEDLILEDLRWLGLDWDEGPVVGGGHGPYRQSERTERYRAAARTLIDTGSAYRCFCAVELLEADRSRQREAGEPPRYVGRCRALTAEESERRGALEQFALRFRVSAERIAFEDVIRGRVEFPGAQIGDPVILRADGTPTYNFDVVVDDVDMKITHVIRGEDHLSNTPRQVLIYDALGAEAPIFAHVSMVLGPDGSPLSKRHGASSVADFRERGFLKEAMVNYLVLLGWSHPSGKEILGVPEILESFKLEKVARAAAMFDVKKLSWLNAHHLRSQGPAQLAASCRERLVAAGYVTANAGSPQLEDWLGRALQTFSGQMETLADAPRATHGLFRFEEFLDSDEKAIQTLSSLRSEPSAMKVVTSFAQRVEALRPPLLYDRASFRQVTAEVAQEAGVKGRALYHPLRVALTGAEEGPELDRVVPLIDEGSALALPEAILSCASRARAVGRRLA